MYCNRIVQRILFRIQLLRCIQFHLQCFLIRMIFSMILGVKTLLQCIQKLCVHILCQCQMKIISK